MRKAVIHGVNVAALTRPQRHPAGTPCATPHAKPPCVARTYRATTPTQAGHSRAIPGASVRPRGSQSRGGARRAGWQEHTCTWRESGVAGGVGTEYADHASGVTAWRVPVCAGSVRNQQDWRAWAASPRAMRRERACGAAYVRIRCVSVSRPPATSGDARSKHLCTRAHSLRVCESMTLQSTCGHRSSGE